MRGNLLAGATCKLLVGSIPACAGEPNAGRKYAELGGVYPRVCGGTATATAVEIGGRGLSPRVRGNPTPMTVPTLRPRSIPACAGEPEDITRYHKPGEVYPRVCGGTSPDCNASEKYQGLSPRVRGNRRLCPQTDAPRGSIPACAGEPLSVGDWCGDRTVYPRVCGGTADVCINALARGGLSPRVRGNHAASYSASLSSGSIPACAGEPLYGIRRPPLSAVYPRVCGGTTSTDNQRIAANGLSPRVRGNLWR